MLDKVRDEWAVRYYKWALEDARREVSQGLRLVRSIKGALAMRAVCYLERFSAIEQIELLRALMKRFHARAVVLTGDHPTRREQELIRAKDDAVLLLTLPGEVSQGPVSSINGRRMNRSRFSRLLKNELVELYGEPGPADKKAGFFRTLVGKWTLTTIVSYAHPPFYIQNVRVSERSSLQEAISVLSWLGLGQPTWDLARAGDELDVVRSIRDCCAHFSQAAPDLLSDLSL